MKTALKIVDRLGLLEDQIAALQDEAEGLKNQLKMMGAGTYAGAMYITMVKACAGRRTTAWKKVAEACNAPADIVEKFTTLGDPTMSAETKPLAN